MTAEQPTTAQLVDRRAAQLKTRASFANVTAFGKCDPGGHAAQGHVRGEFFGPFSDLRTNR
jgi:hypothetical protein